MLALGIYENGLSSCGFHHSLAQDKNNYFTFEDETCPVCRGRDRYARIQASRDRQSMIAAHGKDPDDWPPEAPRPSDGRRTLIRMMDPLEVTARRQKGRG